MNASIMLLPGDGIGPEVTASAVRMLEAVATAGRHRFTFRSGLIGGASIDALGTPLTKETLAACKESDAVLLGAVGGPRWDGAAPDYRPEQGLLQLRKGLGVFANLRPVVNMGIDLADSPFRPDHLAGIDIMVVRELTGGVYFGQPRFRENRKGGVRAVDTLEYSEGEIRRVVRLAFRIAGGRRKRVTSVDKANVLETSRLWRETAQQVAAEFPDTVLEHMLVDSAAMRLMTSPRAFDVIVTENMFGDILTDEASVLAGSLGMLPSASLGDGGPGLYEPVHGSAPDIAGTGKANPIGAVLSAAMLLDHSLGLHTASHMISAAVRLALSRGHRTADLGGAASTQEMSQAILEEYLALASQSDTGVSS